jgi:hypothetical protein
MVFNIFPEVSSLHKQDVVQLTARGVLPVELSATDDEFQRSIQTTADSATNSAIKNCNKLAREEASAAGKGNEISFEPKQKFLKFCAEEFEQVKPTPTSQECSDTSLRG